MSYENLDHYRNTDCMVDFLSGARGNLVSLVIGAFTFTTFIANIMLLIVLMGDSTDDNGDDVE